MAVATYPREHTIPELKRQISLLSGNCYRDMVKEGKPNPRIYQLLREAAAMAGGSTGLGGFL